MPLRILSVGRMLPPVLAEFGGYKPDSVIQIKTRALVGSGVIGSAALGLFYWSARETGYSILGWIGGGFALGLTAWLVTRLREREEGEDVVEVPQVRSRVTLSTPNHDSKISEFSSFLIHLKEAIKGYFDDLNIKKAELKSQSEIVKKLTDELDSATKKHRATLKEARQILDLLKGVFITIEQLSSEHGDLIKDPRTEGDRVSYDEFWKDPAFSETLR